MTPLARRVMGKVREKAPGTYEEWVQAHVDATLDEAICIVEYVKFALGKDILPALESLKEQEPSP